MTERSELEIFDSKTSKIYKDKQLNAADFGKFNLNNYLIFLHLISKIGGVDECGKYLQPHQIEREHTLTAKEFSNLFNTDIRSSYNYLKKAVNKLMSSHIKIETANVISRINVCAKADYCKNKGSVIVRFTEEIIPYLTQVKENFVLYNLKEVAQFNSIYTTRVYELLQGYKETGWMVMSLKQLRFSLATGTAFKLYSDFKKYTFGRACKEINEVYNLDLSFEEIKEGRKVVAIRFTFNKTKIHKAVNPKTGKPMNIYEKPKPKTKSDVSNLPEVLEGQMVFDDLPKNLGNVVQGFADNLKQKRSEKF